MPLNFIAFSVWYCLARSESKIQQIDVKWSANSKMLDLLRSKILFQPEQSLYSCFKTLRLITLHNYQMMAVSYNMTFLFYVTPCQKIKQNKTKKNNPAVPSGLTPSLWICENMVLQNRFYQITMKAYICHRDSFDTNSEWCHQLDSILL